MGKIGDIAGKSLDWLVPRLARLISLDSPRSLYSMIARKVAKPKAPRLGSLLVLSSLIPIVTFVAAALVAPGALAIDSQEPAVSTALQVHVALLALLAAGVVFNAQAMFLRRSYSLIYRVLPTVERGLAGHHLVTVLRPSHGG